MKTTKKKSEVRDKKSEVNAEPAAEPVRSPVVFAGACPRSPHHNATRVYRTAGQTRYCICDDCGERWKKVGPPATPAEPAEV